MGFNVEVDGVGGARVRIAEPPTEALLRELVEELRRLGAESVVVETAHEAGDAWIRAGFSEVSRALSAPLSVLERHVRPEAEPSFGSIHVQTDDLEAVVRAVRQFVPRLPGGSQGSVVLPPRDGWTAVYDELCDREPEMLRRLARELADRMGAVVLLIGVEEGRVVRFVLFERGRVMDEYLSVPEYHGPLPPGEVIALAANPTVIGRFTGADPRRIREIAKTAPRPEDLPPAYELIASLGEAFGVSGAEHGYGQAAGCPDAVVLAR